MRGVVQRVTGASVYSDGSLTGTIRKGIVVFIGVMTEDNEEDAAYIVNKVPALRIFNDDMGKMNLSVTDVKGSILAVSQFTLYGDARGGRRPSYIRAADPDKACLLYDRIISTWRGMGIDVQTGVFRTHMDVSLVNDGPVTILLDSRREF